MAWRAQLASGVCKHGELWLFYLWCLVSFELWLSPNPFGGQLEGQL
jgi:hypothetical protein